MSKVCKKHQENPVTIYSKCIGCELENLHRRIREQEELLKWFRERTGGWHHIETAPRDGTFYLASDGKRIWVENWPNGCARGEWHMIGGEWRGAGHESIKRATHWMQLPEPPKG
jgi:hypothetical protein